MTIAPWPDCQHTYACTLSESRCIWCGDIKSSQPTDQWATAPDGEEFRAGECQGHDVCPVKTHEHGCFADTGNCDHPEEHESSEPSLEGV